MPPASKSRSSVAAELVLALSKPKGRVVKEDEPPKPSEKVGKKVDTAIGKDHEKSISSQGNNDWISFLKTKQGNESPSSKNSRSPVAKTPSNKLKRHNQTSSPRASDKIKSEPKFDVSEETSDKEKERDKDLVLKSLMEQVSSLETTLGGKIQDLEASLKTERSRCKQLETTLEKEVKLQQEATSKLKVVQKDNDRMEKDLRNKIEEFKMSFEEEKKKGFKMATDFAKFKVDTQEEIKLKDGELIEILTENDELRSKMTTMIAWKEDLTRKVSDGIQYCRINHTDKLQTVIDENLKLRSVMKAAKDNFKEVTNDLWKTVNDINVENANLNSRICKERVPLNEDFNNDGRKVMDIDDFSMNGDKIEKIKMKNEKEEYITCSEEFEENIHTSRKRKRAGDESVLKKIKSSDDQAKTPDIDVECLSENSRKTIDKNESEVMKKTKESLRDDILSSLSSQDETDLKMDCIQDQPGNLDESLLQSPQFDAKLLHDEAKSGSRDPVTLDEDINDDDPKEDALSPLKSPLPWTHESKNKNNNSSSAISFRLINECDDGKEQDRDMYDEVDIDLLYGDLEVGEEPDLKISHGDVGIDATRAVECEFDESFGSLDSGELVIDLDESGDNLGMENGFDTLISSSNAIKEMLVELVNSI